jgi:hypothetical protein
MLKGYKTYIVAAVAVVTAIGAFLAGDASAIQAAQLAFTAIIGAFIRNGVASTV